MNNILIWVIYLILGILLTMLAMIAIRKLEQVVSELSGKPEDTSSPSIMSSMITCILIDVLIYVISGMYLNPREFPVWAIIIYAIVFEIVTQCFLTYLYPQFFNATWLKSVVDVTLISLFYWLGSWLQSRAKHKGREEEARKIKRNCHRTVCSK